MFTYFFFLAGEGSTDILKEFFEANVTKIVISLIICVFGLIGNLVAIFVIAILKEYQKSVTHWYVVEFQVFANNLLFIIHILRDFLLDYACLFYGYTIRR